MRAREIAHILTITPDPENDDDWSWEIECPYVLIGFDRDKCPCQTVMECNCTLSAEDRKALLDADEAPCPSSPSGVHRPIPEGVAGHEINRCWAQVCDFACDAAADVHTEYGAGTYAIAVIGGWEELEFDVLARVEAVAS